MTNQPLPLPSPQEPIVDDGGKVTPRWWQFLVPLFDRLVDTRKTQFEHSEIISFQGVEISVVRKIAQTNEGVIASIEEKIEGQDITISEVKKLSETNEGSVASIEEKIEGQDLTISEVKTLSETNEGSIASINQSITDQNTTIEQVQSLSNANNDDIAGIKAKWGVAINSSGQLVGLVQLDSVNAYSTFTVVADKFLVANPTASGDVRQVFVIAQVDGVPTVGIDGDLIADGTIQARSLVAEKLSAISADLGTITAGKMQSDDGKFVIDLDNKTISITT